MTAETMWLCDSCGDGGMGGFVLSRDALHAHMSAQVHFVGWISWPTNGWSSLRVEVVTTPEGVFYIKHDPFPEPERPGN